MQQRFEPTPPNDYVNSLQQFCNAVVQGGSEVASYSNNYRAVHTSALSNTFATTRSLLPTQVFTALAQVYAKHYQPKQWDINLYGDQFSNFLNAQHNSPKANYYDWLWLANIAAIEYAISVVYYAEDGAFTCVEPLKIHPAEHGNNSLDASLEKSIGQHLQQQHPYCLVKPQLQLSHEILLWREAQRIRIDNS